MSGILMPDQTSSGGGGSTSLEVLEDHANNIVKGIELGAVNTGTQEYPVLLDSKASFSINADDLQLNGFSHRNYIRSTSTSYANTVTIKEQSGNVLGTFNVDFPLAGQVGNPPAPAPQIVQDASSNINGYGGNIYIWQAYGDDTGWAISSHRLYRCAVGQTFTSPSGEQTMAGYWVWRAVALSSEPTSGLTQAQLGNLYVFGLHEDTGRHGKRVRFSDFPSPFKGWNTSQQAGSGSVSDVAGNVPAGTVVEFCYAGKMPDGSYRYRNTVTHTITGSGGMQVDGRQGQYALLNDAGSQYNSSGVSGRTKVFYRVNGTGTWHEGNDNYSDTNITQWPFNSATSLTVSSNDYVPPFVNGIDCRMVAAMLNSDGVGTSIGEEYMSVVYTYVNDYIGTYNRLTNTWTRGPGVGSDGTYGIPSDGIFAATTTISYMGDQITDPTAKFSVVMNSVIAPNCNRYGLWVSNNFGGPYNQVVETSSGVQVRVDTLTSNTSTIPTGNTTDSYPALYGVRPTNVSWTGDLDVPTGSSIVVTYATSMGSTTDSYLTTHTVKIPVKY